MTRGPLWPFAELGLGTWNGRCPALRGRGTRRRHGSALPLPMGRSAGGAILPGCGRGHRSVPDPPASEGSQSGGSLGPRDQRCAYLPEGYKPPKVKGGGRAWGKGRGRNLRHRSGESPCCPSRNLHLVPRPQPFHLAPLLLLVPILKDSKFLCLFLENVSGKTCDVSYDYHLGERVRMWAFLGPPERFQ